MFCPRCATQNGWDQGYCRQCGQALFGVRLALEGTAEQSLEKLKAGEKWINGGSATLATFTLIAIAITILSIAIGDPSLSYIAIINFFLGASVGLPLIYLGKSKVKRATRLLSQTESRRSTLQHPAQPDNLLTTGLNADLLRPPVQGSVAEHTTLHLQKSGGQTSTAGRPRKVP